MDFDGVVLSKLDGDTRGGAALSIKAVVNKPIKFIGTGEKMEALFNIGIIQEQVILIEVDMVDILHKVLPQQCLLTQMIMSMLLVVLVDH